MTWRGRDRNAVKDLAQEAGLFRVRAAEGFLIIAICLAVLLARYAWLQVLRHDEFSGRADENRIKLKPLPPSRGLIYDRNGVLLAENILDYRLELIPEQVGDIDEALQRLGKVIAISADDRDQFEALRKVKRRFHNIPLRYALSEQEVSRFALERHRFPGVEVVPYLTRFYPHGSDFAHVIGYVARIDSDDRERLEEARYSATTHIGKTGIERYYEDLLLGDVGYERIETNAEGRALRVLGRVPSKPGQHLRLSIDANLQRATVAAFAGRTGAAVAIDPRNGEVLAMVSQPAFDPNLFVNGISRRDYAALLNAVQRPLYNRAVLGGYEPGSTIKPFIGLMGLRLGLRTPETTIWSSGEFHLPGQSAVWRDWKRGGHGSVNLREALAQSVNTYFYGLAVDTGIDRMEPEMRAFGFGAPTGLDLTGEPFGVVPSRSWKQKRFGKTWYPGETVIAGIGQGYWVVTPVQLAHALATLAARGVSHPPHLLLSLQAGIDAQPQPVPIAADGPPIVASPEMWDAIREGMEAVMHSPTGTARAFGIDAPYRIAGKSGTAQRARRRGNQEYNENTTPEHLRHQALFVAFAPTDAPTIAVAVVVEHGSSGSKAAAPVARAILDAYLLKPKSEMSP
ncbi:MAG: penicillin-binding protein 2 [Rhodanobacteraceae bacterium]|mgnify:CR=1 FL=1|nr:penicillin-binding protein 2 [Rhodanobacteraceae bacterium]MBP9154400.1 penicillin-binding protein 2 [Xanthomonadales bacterium]HQW81601.1 penicillin-binding protein 2 [Pseudomonadota bacterium]